MARLSQVGLPVKLNELLPIELPSLPERGRVGIAAAVLLVSDLHLGPDVVSALFEAVDGEGREREGREDERLGEGGGVEELVPFEKSLLVNVKQRWPGGEAVRRYLLGLASCSFLHHG